MSFFDQVFQSLFSKKEASNKVLVHEVISRSNAYKASFDEWKGSESCSQLLNDIRTSYYLKSKGIQGQPDVHLLNSPYSNGFAISFSQEKMNAKQFQYLFDWLAKMVEDLGYRQANKDVKILNKGKFIETKEKYYLKPLQGNEIPINQRFGNILIEHILIDDQPSYLKLVANSYNDRSYSKAESFEALADYLFKVN